MDDTPLFEIAKRDPMMQAISKEMLTKAAIELDRLRMALFDLVAHDEAMVASGIMKPFVELERAQRLLQVPARRLESLVQTEKAE